MSAISNSAKSVLGTRTSLRKTDDPVVRTLSLQQRQIRIEFLRTKSKVKRAELKAARANIMKEIHSITRHLGLKSLIESALEIEAASDSTKMFLAAFERQEWSVHS